jgi:two-component system, chemotaxis family, protein-glutamate methylesterase/glutaminase
MSLRKVSVIIVDDSTFMRKAIRRMLTSDPDIEIIGEAGDGLAGLETIKKLRPSVVTLDVQMPGMDGLQTLQKIMDDFPTPVIMVSSQTNEGAEITMKALEIGAVDFVDKSTCGSAMDIMQLTDALISKVKVLSKVDLNKVGGRRKIRPLTIKHQQTVPSPRSKFLANPSSVVAIGTSTGGPMALETVLTGIPADYPAAILVVQHMPRGFTASLANRLNELCAIEVREAKNDDQIVPGTVYIGKSGFHLKIERTHPGAKIHLDHYPADSAHRPSVDVMMESLAENWQGRMIGVVLTGMGEDGKLGVQAMREKGARIFAQDEATSVVYGMPKAAVNTGCVDKIMSPERIAQELRLIGDKPANPFSRISNFKRIS